MTEYSIWVLEYAAIEAMPETVLLYGGDTRKTRRMPYSFALLKGSNGDVALVDAGYDAATYGHQLATLFGVSHYRDPETMLAECGVSAADVKTIFITHAHFDHVGALSRFPNATLYIQTRELEKWSWALTLGPEAKFLTDAVDPADIIKLAELARTNRLVCVDGDRQDVLPGIDLHLAADTHTFGSMYLTVRNGGENVWVLSGDIVYVYENMTGDDPQQRRYIPIGYASGSQENLILATDTLLKTAGGDPQRVVPFHESRLGDTYPSREVAAGLRIIEVALAKAEASRIG